MKIKYLLFFLVFAVVSCSKKDKKPEIKNEYNNGKITIVTDDSFKSVTQAISDAYMINYPEASVSVKVQKEDFAFLDLLKNKAKLIVMSRELSPEEISEYEKVTQLTFNPAKFAADAVVFVAPINSKRTSVDIKELEQMLASDDKNIIFDGTNSGNLNFVAQKFKKKSADLKFSIISGNSGVVQELDKYPNKIGAISLNTISRPYGAEAQNLRKMVKILPVTVNGKSFEPTRNNLQNMEYPFTRVLFLLANEGNFGLANGIMRFACTQLGQIVVEKEGLQPYNLFKREVQMR